jgi:MFS superfamily sulfate permease-like transporter
MEVSWLSPVTELAQGMVLPTRSHRSCRPIANAAQFAFPSALLLLLAPTLLEHLPYAALAAVVIASAIGLFEVADLIRIFRIRPWEFWPSMVCFVGVAVLGAIPGIGVAIVIAVLEFLGDGWRPHSAALGRAEGR